MWLKRHRSPTTSTHFFSLKAQKLESTPMYFHGSRNSTFRMTHVADVGRRARPREHDWQSARTASSLEREGRTQPPRELTSALNREGRTTPAENYIGTAQGSWVELREQASLSSAYRCSLEEWKLETGKWRVLPGRTQKTPYQHLYGHLMSFFFLWNIHAWSFDDQLSRKQSTAPWRVWRSGARPCIIRLITRPLTRVYWCFSAVRVYVPRARATRA